jgi:hypothetical protein
LKPGPEPDAKRRRNGRRKNVKRGEKKRSVRLTCKAGRNERGRNMK